jgi:hypothetical protein
MNDSELDRLLDSWNAPAVPRSLRRGLRAQLRPVQRFRFFRPLGWVAVVLLFCTALAIGTGRLRERRSDFPVLTFLNQIYTNWTQRRDVDRASRMVRNIMQSDPKVYVDGHLAAPLKYGPAATMVVQIPGDGSYTISLYRDMEPWSADGAPTGWFEAGRVRGRVIEFRVADKQVRIECSNPIVVSGRRCGVRRHSERSRTTS